MRTNEEKVKAKGLAPFTLGAIASATSYTVLSNLTYALTQSFGLTAMVVGAIMLGSRILDGFTDVIATFIIDRTHTKWGKARPYDLMLIPLWIFVVLCFSVPGTFGTIGKVVWVILTYNMCQSVFYTFVQAADATRLRRTFAESVRAKVVSACGVVSTLGGIIVGFILPILISIFENQPHGWTIISAIFAIPCIIGSIFRFLLVKEMKVEEEDAVKKEDVSFITAIKVLFQNKYVFMLVCCIVDI